MKTGDKVLVNCLPEQFGFLRGVDFTITEIIEKRAKVKNGPTILTVPIKYLTRIG